VTGDVTGSELAEVCQQSYVRVTGCNSMLEHGIGTGKGLGTGTRTGTKIETEILRVVLVIPEFKHGTESWESWESV